MKQITDRKRLDSIDGSTLAAAQDKVAAQKQVVQS